MDLRPRILRVSSISTATTRFQRDAGQTPTAHADYVLSEALFLPHSTAATPDDKVAVISKLNSIAAKYAHFHQSIAPCVLASCCDLDTHSKVAASFRTAGVPQYPSENEKFANVADRVKSGGSTTTSRAPPDLNAFWSATSPLPPTAVLTALYSLLPLRHVSAANGDTHDNSNVGETGAEEANASGVPIQRPLNSLEALWTLCKSAESIENGQRQVSFWEAFSMTAVTVQRAVGGNIYNCDIGSSQSSSRSASSFSLSHQLRRATAVLSSLQQGDSTASVLSPTTSLLEWPEGFLWSLLMSLLSVLALVHSAGLHFFGQLTASNVLCFACTSSVPRLLQQTWQDVVAANRIQKQGVAHTDSVALFRQFYSMASQSVLLPEASLTSETPCHNVFFVVQPSLDLLRRRQTADKAEASVAVTSAAQEAADETPEQQAHFQDADLASVGRLLQTMMELRDQWAHKGGQRSSSFAAIAHPSTELVFLVRRLCECEVETGSNPQRGGPTALQLLQLQALRLRTETWYYHRLAAEAYDRLSQLQVAQNTAQPPESSGILAQKTEVEQHTAARRAQEEEKLRAREAAVTEREAKLDLILRVYELTHEHLDAMNPPTSQPPSIHHSRASHPVDQRCEETPRDDSLKALRSAPAYRQAAATTPEGIKAPVTNISHHQQRRTEAVAAGTTETSGDALLGLSPLVGASNAEGVDTTLLSASATPFTALREVDQRVVEETQPLPWSVPMTHCTLTVDEPARTLIAKARKTAEAQQPSQTVVELNEETATKENNAFRGSARLTPLLPLNKERNMSWDTLPAQAHQQDPNFSPQEVSDVTVVEVELDDGIDSDDAAKAQPNSHSSAAAGLWSTQSVAQDGRQALNRPQRESQLVTSPRQQPPPPSSFVSSISASFTSRLAQDLTTPVRAPTLPNMGTTDADASGTNTGGRGGSLSKYSSLAQLRSPPSTRRPASGSKEADSSLSLSPHSPEGYRSSTKPNMTAALAVTTTATTPTTNVSDALPKQYSQPCSARRRSSSRGGGGSGARLEQRPSGTSTPNNDGTVTSGLNSEKGGWARQQLTELQNMQTALRSQQPATPRSRAIGSTGGASAAVVTGAELNTPELRRVCSPVSSASSPPLRPAREALLTPPSPHSLVTSPTRRLGHTNRSPLGTDSSHRTRSSNHRSYGHPKQQDTPLESTYSDKEKGDARREEQLTQMQGTPGPVVNALKTPRSSRRHHEDAWATSAAQRPTPVLSERSTPPTQNVHLSSKRTTAGGSGRARPDTHSSAHYHPTTTATTINNNNIHATSAFAAALGAALRTPLRQSAPTIDAADLADHRRLTNQFNPSSAPPPSSPSSSFALESAKKNDGTTSATRSTSSRNRPAARASCSRNVTTSTMVRTTTVSAGSGGVEVSPLRTANVGGGHSGSVHSALRHNNGAAQRLHHSAPVRRSGAEGDVPSSSALPSSAALSSTGLVSASGKVAHPLRANTSSMSAMELLRRLRASSAATA